MTKEKTGLFSKWGKPGLIGIVLIALVIFPITGGGNIMTVLTLVFIYMALGQMWNLMGGYAGLLSLGMQAFIGIGGYSLAVFSVTYGLNVYASIFLGAIISVVFALIVSPALFKMSGVYFAIGSWVVAEALVIWFSNWEFVHYAQGIGISTVYAISPEQIYYTALILGVGSILVVFLIMRSKTGLVLMAMRDSASSAETMGVKLYKTKLICYLVSSFVTGLAGGIVYMQQGYIIPTSGFSISWTIAMTFMVIIGGMSTMEGPIIGAIIYVVLTQYLYNFPGISMIILGAIAILVIMVAPKGITGTIYNKTGFEILSLRRKINSDAPFVKKNAVQE